MKFYLVVLAFFINYVSLAQGKVVYLKTPGITCEACETYIENKLMRVDGITEVDVNPYGKTTRVVYFSTKITLQEIKYNLADLGFVADEVMPEEPTFKNMPDCCRATAKSSYELALAESKKPKPVVPAPVKADTVKAKPVAPMPVKPASAPKPAGVKPAATKTSTSAKPATVAKPAAATTKKEVVNSKPKTLQKAN
jgi:periplasmic mercuric ion binding protein